MIENGREVRHPLVSVIVPAYNVAEYVKTIYNSVLAQTYPDWELVLWMTARLIRLRLWYKI